MKNVTEKEAANRENLFCPLCKYPLTFILDQYYCMKCSRSYGFEDDIPRLVPDIQRKDGFNPDAFEFLHQMEQRHFWHIGRREIIFGALEKFANIKADKILEIGCGNGSVLNFLTKKGAHIDGGDIFLEGLKFCKEENSAVCLYQIDILSLPFLNNYDIIGIFDVLEHIENDSKALTEIFHALKPGGKLIITVPAHMYLWSDFDETSSHKRRYSNKDILNKLERSGFIVRRTSYFISILFPVLACMRIFRKIFPKKRRNIESSLELRTLPWVNILLLCVLRFEKFLLNYFDLPQGASLLIIAERPKDKVEISTEVAG